MVTLLLRLRNTEFYTQALTLVNSYFSLHKATRSLTPNLACFRNTFKQPPIMFNLDESQLADNHVVVTLDKK
ncbi:hypothetical protein [cyanobacterium endosymbiont of Rhopalodia gibberula]|uniref:hypothetical protein n=1 Tax=cyanobacterium endosymbiont of Rhopalodia gibberula TaxID=1763363 RepID=UPI000E65706A|nr:hypothetical protein [cyanobacterium endosymbiont of Rhopalodia gibberula]